MTNQLDPAIFNPHQTQILHYNKHKNINFKSMMVLLLLLLLAIAVFYVIYLNSTTQIKQDQGIDLTVIPDQSNYEG